MHFDEDLKKKLVEAVYKQPSAIKNKCIAIARQLSLIYGEEKSLNESLNRHGHESFQRMRELHGEVLATLFEGSGAALADPDTFFTKEEQEMPEFTQAAVRVERKGWWGRILAAVPDIEETIEPEDKDVLEFLSDVNVITEPTRPVYTVEFSFESNPYFHNDCLRVEVIRSVEGEEVVELRATPIQWKDGKDLTTATKKTKNRGKNRPQKTITVRKPSFFLNFTSLCEPEESHDEEEEDEEAPPCDAKIFYNACQVFETIRFELLPCLAPLLLGVKVPLLGETALPTDLGASAAAKPECKAQ